MDTQGALISILSRADAELRRLMEDLLTQGKYADVELGARVAKALGRIAKDVGTGSLAEVPSGPELPPPEQQPAESQVPRRRAARDYPKFKRDGDRLVKVAWSKHERKEYEHRAPQRVVDCLLETIRKKKGEGRAFQADDIFPIKDTSTKQEVPSYQAYLALAWLRHEGLVTKKGRDRYVLKASATADRLGQLWNALPSET